MDWGQKNTSILTGSDISLLPVEERFGWKVGIRCFFKQKLGNRSEWPCRLYLIISQPGISSAIFGKSSCRYALLQDSECAADISVSIICDTPCNTSRVPNVDMSRTYSMTSYRHRIQSPTCSARGTLLRVLFRFLNIIASHP
jgi:hypothetical protein